MVAALLLKKQSCPWSKHFNESFVVTLRILLAPPLVPRCTFLIGCLAFFVFRHIGTAHYLLVIIAAHVAV